MTEQTYSIEEIKDVIESLPLANPSLVFEAVQTRLTRPKHNFSEGEVAMRKNGFGDFMPIIVGCAAFSQDGEIRKQTLREMPQEVADLREAMERISAGDIGNGGYESVYCPFAKDALAAFGAAIKPE